MKIYEKIIWVPEPNFDDYQQIMRLLEKMGWHGYHTNYTGEQLDNGDYGDDVHDYTVCVPEDELDIFEWLCDKGALD